jgi:hypothetical protein
VAIALDAAVQAILKLDDSVPPGSMDWEYPN